MRWVLDLLLAVMWVALVIAFPRLTDVGATNYYLCFYPCLIPGLVAVPMAIMFGPLVFNEITKGRLAHD